MTNKEAMPLILPFYDEKVIDLIMEKYGFSFFKAVKKFIYSETYAMLTDIELEMWDFGPIAIFDMWVAEQITGDPRNSIYIRGD